MNGIQHVQELAGLQCSVHMIKYASSFSYSSLTGIPPCLYRYQTDLPEVISSRDPPHLTHEELARVMKWKLTVRA